MVRPVGLKTYWRLYVFMRIPFADIGNYPTLFPETKPLDSSVRAKRLFERPPPRSILEMSTLHTVQILLVEDSEDDAFFFRWTLRKCSVPTELVHVIDGAAALQHLQAVLAGTQPRPDIVFLDLKVPSFSGFDILEWLRQHAVTPPLNVVVLSGSEHASDMARAEALGAAAYFVKPITVEQMQARLTDAAAALT